MLRPPSAYRKIMDPCHVGNSQIWSSLTLQGKKIWMLKEKKIMGICNAKCLLCEFIILNLAT